MATPRDYKLDDWLPGVMNSAIDLSGCRSCGRKTQDPIEGHDGYCPVPALFVMKLELDTLRAAASTRSLAGVPDAGGALTGWRLLEVGEVIRDGDEYYIKNSWRTIKSSIIGREFDDPNDAIRRRMSAQRAAPLPDAAPTQTVRSLQMEWDDVDAARAVVDAAIAWQRWHSKDGNSGHYPPVQNLIDAVAALPPQARGDDRTDQSTGTGDVRDYFVERSKRAALPPAPAADE